MNKPIAAILLALAVGAAHAQTTMQHGSMGEKPMAAKTSADSKDMADAEVRKIDKDAKKITLKHGPIKNLDMPGMTMVFQVKDAMLLDKLAVGDKVKFSAEQQQGAFVVTGVEKAPSP